jgi:circadian clock protein KaiB
MKKNYILKLYILGKTSVAKKAIENLKEICQLNELKDKYTIEIINLLERPELAEQERILATPVLIKELPKPLKRIIGDLSNHEKVLVGLDLQEDTCE